MLSVRDEEIASFGLRSLKAPTINCPSGNRICYVCTNKDCLFDAFSCFEENCLSCQPQNHESCADKFSKFSNLTRKIEEKVNFKVSILKSIFEEQEKIIKQLRESRKKLIAQKEKIESQEMQVLIDSIFEKKSIKGLTGAAMSYLLQQLTPIKFQQNKLYEQLFKIEMEGFKMINKLSILREAIFESLARIKREIMNKEQKAYLLRQLNYPTNLKLIFRASQHNFSSSKFHQLCDGISDTVTVVRTEFGKTFAAYTPLKWGPQNKRGSVADDSKKSFILHFDLKEKMTLIQPQNAIFNSSRFGPVFGDYDINIRDQCNQNQISSSFFPRSYNCNGKYQNNQESQTAFCGNPDARCFRVVEYEVFALSK